MMRTLCCATTLSTLLFFGLVVASQATAKSLILRGEGTTGFGGTGEGITVTVELNTEDFTYVPVANPVFHLFDAIRTVPVTIELENSGFLEGVSPVREFSALELTEDDGVTDQIGLRVYSGNSATSLVKFFCRSNDCFDGDVTPFTGDQLFDLFEEAVTDTSRWQVSSALSAVFTGSDGDFFSFGPLEWSIFNPDAPRLYEVEPIFDVEYELSEVPQIVEGATGLLIGGIPGHSTFPEVRPVMEFPLDGLPAGARVLSAKLELDPYVSSGSPRIEVTGYAGDGEPSLLDGAIAGPVLATSEALTAGDDALLELDPVYIESLLGSDAQLGVRLRSLDVPEYLGVYSSDVSFSSLNPPKLLIEYEYDGLPGDHNDDGVVDAADYTIWRDGFGSSYASREYATWSANYGSTEEPAAAHATAPVPEPSALLLAVGFCAVGLTRGW